MSYKIDTNTDSSKIIHLNTIDADLYYQSGLTTYCSFNLQTPIQIQKEHAALLSLNSAIIPYSMYNIRDGINNRIPYRLVANDTLNSLIIPTGNYTITTLAKKVKDLLDALVGGNTYIISFDRTLMKYKFSASTNEIYFDFSAFNDTAHIELGFNKDEITPDSGIGQSPLTSTNVADVNGSTHSLFIRTNLTTKSSIDSQTKSFSTILGKIPINTNFGSVLFYNPRDNIHKIILDTHLISNITIRITDEFNRTINLNGLNCNLSILVDIVNKKDFVSKEFRRNKEIFLQSQIEQKNNKIETRGRPRKVGRPKKQKEENN